MPSDEQRPKGTPVQHEAPSPDSPCAAQQRVQLQCLVDAVANDQPIIIGLTGTIASGKSTFATLLSERGAKVIDSDQRAKAVLDREEVRDAIAQRWGAELLSEDGKIDRAKLAAVIFADPDQREHLQAMIYPKLKAERQEMVTKCSKEAIGVVVIDAPLLLEAGVDSECDVVVVVDAPLNIRIERAIARSGWDEAEFHRREAAQWTPDRKRAAADCVVENSGSISGLTRQADALYAILRARGTSVRDKGS